ncbi:head-tail connector protein [Derxia gummosa]|uniref:Head-tail connector protein n=1 Tax=Derxia gummosa DSM 723 TaxID=1121388 RepID=A0A8B6X2S2_9BURK|nr:head-tail connector protein [Derxia gummosa]
MPAPDLALVKSWCRIDGTEFDGQLPTMVTAATAMASHETGIDYLTEEMPEAVQQWCAAVVSHWLSNPGSEAAPSPFMARLLDPHRTY